MRPVSTFFDIQLSNSRADAEESQTPEEEQPTDTEE